METMEPSLCMQRAQQITHGIGTVRVVEPSDLRDALSNETCMMFSVEDDGIAYCLRCSKDKGLKTCKRCCIAHYCSRACQIEDWPSHKPFCNARRARDVLEYRDDRLYAMCSLKKDERLKVQYVEASVTALRALFKIRVAARVEGYEDVYDRAWPLILQALEGPQSWLMREGREFDCIEEVVSTPLDHFIYKILQGKFGEAVVDRAVRLIGYSTWSAGITSRLIVPRHALCAGRCPSVEESGIVICHYTTDKTPFFYVVRDIQAGDEVTVHRDDMKGL